MVRLLRGCCACLADPVLWRASVYLRCAQAAVEPVWYLPGVAERFGCDEGTLRRCLFHETNGMYPELVTRPDLKVFLPPIGGLTVCWRVTASPMRCGVQLRASPLRRASVQIYIFGNVETIANPDIELTVRVHDECNGSDVFGSDICTCRPYLIHGIEECIRTAQKGG
jgi:GTP cyclohydrolase II